MSETKSSAPTAIALGVAGLIPFLFAPIVHLTGDLAVAPRLLNIPVATLVFYTYSPVIASFLCGTWWGRALAADQAAPVTLVLSNVLALAAWAASAGLVGIAQPLALAAVFAALLAGEFLLPVLAGAPRYYRNLRTGLTVVVIACHIAMALLA